MHTGKIEFALCFFFFFSTVFPLSSQAEGKAGEGESKATIDYFLHMEKPNSHYFDVSIGVSGIKTDHLDFVMPSWSPGRYAIYDFVREVTNVRAADKKGEPLKVERVDKNTFRVYHGSADIVFYYSVYANYLSATFCKLSESGAVINGASLFMYVKYRDTLPCSISVYLPQDKGWSIVSPLARVEGSGIYRADNYRQLIDSPFLAGEFSRYAFESRSTPFHVIFHESPNAGDRSDVVAKIKKICEAAYDLYGEYPFRSYFFFFDFLSGPGEWDAMEHRNSMRFTDTVAYDTDEKIFEIERIAAHELFHAWNVRAVMPTELEWCDLTKEVYCPSLWIVEGSASYYQYMLLYRAGIMSRDRFRKKLCDIVSDFEASPGKDHMALSEAALLPWLDRSGPEDSDRQNTTVSYYTKGAITCLLLDMEIRTLSAGKKGLDDVQRELYYGFKENSRGYTEEDFLRLCVASGGDTIREFLGLYVESKAQLPYSAVSGAAGLILEKRSNRTMPFIGIRTEQRNIIWVIPGSPAEEAGLEKFDEIFAIGSKPVTDGSLDLYSLHPGQRTSISVFRHGKALRFPLIIGSHAIYDYKFEDLATDNAQLLRIRESFYAGKPQK
jgi:predicted metalloprotease with PDZ domain